MNTSLEHLSDSQYEVLKQFRRNVSDVLPHDYTDAYLLKWLRALNYNLKKTEDHFRANMRFRTLYELDSIAEKYVKPEILRKYEFSTFLGRAKDGTPLRYTQFGSADLVGLLMSLSGYQLSIYSSYLIEHDTAMMKKYRKETGKEVSRITYIVDIDGFSISQFLNKSTLETTLDLLQIMQDHYPELWGNIFIVNAPGYFDKVFHIIKPIMRLTMLQKIRLASRESTPSLLLRYVDENVLPSFLGGKRTDSSGDPRCSEFIKFGGKVPEEYYLRNRTHLTPTDPGVRSLWISPRSVYNYAAVVRHEHSKIHVEFRSENGSIGLKMQFRELGDNPEILDLPACDEYLDENKPESNVFYVSPYLRIQSHSSPVDQIVNAPWPGIYIFRFDNTYSWFTSRKIIFRIRVIQKG